MKQNFFYCKDCWKEGIHYGKLHQKEENELTILKNIQKELTDALLKEDLKSINKCLQVKGMTLDFVVDENGNYPIHIACSSSSDDIAFEIMNIFVKFSKEIDFDVENFMKASAAYLCVEQGYLKTLKLLIQNGLDLKKEKYGNIINFQFEQCQIKRKLSKRHSRENQRTKYSKLGGSQKNQ